MTKIFLIVFGVAINAHLRAQDFDADSIRYTPISKPKTETAKRSPRVFKDTIEHQKFISYYFNINVGALAGCDNCASPNTITFTTSTVHGITIGKKFRVGAGIGLDAYDGWQTIPFFGQLGYDVLGTRNTNALFLDAQYGWAHAWDNRRPEEFSLIDVNGGAMLGGQIGYRIKYRDVRIGLVLGMKRQVVSSYYEYPTFYTNPLGIWVAGSPSKITIEREMRRVLIALQIGWK
ncbi:MAG: hypothetical protein WKF87_19670 [Chryseolinea sp.]